MTRTSKTSRKNTILEVFELVKNGHKLIEARKTIGTKVGRSAGTLLNWQNKLNMKTPVVTTKIAKSTNNVAITRNITVDPNIPAQLKRVLTAHVSDTGEFSTKQVLATCQLSSGILAFNKHELEVAKFLNKNLSRTNR